MLTKKNQPDPDLFSLHLKELGSHIMLESYLKKCGFTALFCASFFILMLQLYMKFWFPHPASCTRKVFTNKSTEDMGRKWVGGMDWETAWWGTWSSTSRLTVNCGSLLVGGIPA